jgi:L-methionine (R)-S-oxide reductase
LPVAWCDEWLAEYLRSLGAVAGSVHLVEGAGMRLIGAVNLPAKVQQVVEWVPRGKGMAGQALERGGPVFTCNLKDDSSGAVRPGAKAVDAQAAVAMPVRDGSNVIVAIVGLAFANQRDFTKSDLEAFEMAAMGLPTRIHDAQRE